MSSAGGSDEPRTDTSGGDEPERPWGKFVAALIAIVALLVSGFLAYSAFKGTAVAANFTRVGGATRIETAVDAADFWRRPPSRVVIAAFDRSGSAASERLLLGAAQCAAANDAPLLFDARGRSGTAVRPRLVKRLLAGWHAQRRGTPPQVFDIRSDADAAECPGALAGAVAGLHTFTGDTDVVPALPAVNPRAKLAPFVVFAAPRAAHDVPDVAVAFALAAHLATPARQVSLVVVPRYLESDPELEAQLRGRRELVQDGVVLGQTIVLPDDTRTVLRQVLQPFNRAGLFGEVRTDLGSLGTAIAAVAALLGAAVATRTAAPLVESASRGLITFTKRPRGDPAGRSDRPAAHGPAAEMRPASSAVGPDVDTVASTPAPPVPVAPRERSAAGLPATTRNDPIRDAAGAAVTLGWYLAALAHAGPVAETSAGAAGVTPMDSETFDDGMAREYCASSARAALARLAQTFAGFPGDLGSTAKWLATTQFDPQDRQQAVRVYPLMLADLDAAEPRLGQAYGLGGALLRLTTRPTPRTSLADHLADRAELAASALEDLVSTLPEHAGRAVRTSLMEWVETVRDGRDRAAEPDQWARLSRQGFVWFMLLTGRRRGEDVLERDDYIDVSDGLSKGTRMLALRVVRGFSALIVLMLTLMAGGVVLMFASVGSPAMNEGGRSDAALVTGIAALIVGIGVLWRAGSSVLSTLVRRSQGPLWDRELEAAIARAISLAAPAARDGRARNRQIAEIVGGDPQRRRAAF